MQTQRVLDEFKNEPFTDYSKPENADAMRAALEKVRGELGREYLGIDSSAEYVDLARRRLVDEFPEKHRREA